MTQFAIIDLQTRVVIGACGIIDPIDFVGPPAPMPETQEGTELRYWQTKLNFSEAPTSRHVYAWHIDADFPEWEDRGDTQQAIDNAVDRINAERDRLIATFDRFEFEGNIYDGNAAAKENILDAADSAAAGDPLPPNFTWRTFDNQDVPMTNADLLRLKGAFRVAYNLHKFTMHAIARGLKDYAQTPNLSNEQLDAIMWPL